MKLSRPLVIFDLETTGIWVEKDKIVEIGMIKLLPDDSRQDFLKRVNPGMPIPANVTRIIDITDEDVKDAPKFKDIANEALEFIGDADLAGFNIKKFLGPGEKFLLHLEILNDRLHHPVNFGKEAEMVLKIANPDQGGPFLCVKRSRLGL